MAAALALAACATQDRQGEVDAQRLAALHLLGDVVRLDAAKQAAAALFPPFPERVPALQSWLHECAEPLRLRQPMVEQALAAVRARALPRTERQRAEGPSPDEPDYADPCDRFLDRMLAALAADLAAFLGQDGQCADVRARLAEAESVQARSIDDHAAEWRSTIAAIAAEPRYRGLAVAPQLGLVPLGADPASHLQEFVHLASGARGKEIPARDPQSGRLVPTGDMGIVFVLLPGGTFTMGAQASVRGQPDYDAMAQANETPHAVTLAPFFLSKYELTQGQWSRLWHSDAALRFPSHYRIGATYRGIPGAITARHPVENVSWCMCEGLVSQAGLCLPTEAQWEYACRGGTSTPWYTGAAPGSLAGHANLFDYDALASYPDWGVPEGFADGYAGPAPVGWQPGANPFGLSDMHGNVWEWCRDCLCGYEIAARAGDGLRQAAGGVNRVHRGGSYRVNSPLARSAFRFSNAPDTRNFTLGVRPARALGP